MIIRQVEVRDIRNLSSGLYSIDQAMLLLPSEVYYTKLTIQPYFTDTSPRAEHHHLTSTIPRYHVLERRDCNEVFIGRLLCGLLLSMVPWSYFAVSVPYLRLDILSQEEGQPLIPRGGRQQQFQVYNTRD